VLCFHSLNDPFHEHSSGVQRCAALGALDDFSVPPVDGPDWGEVVNAGAQSFGYELASQL